MNELTFMAWYAPLVGGYDSLCYGRFQSYVVYPQEARDELILEVAQFINSELSAYYYSRDFMAAFNITISELKIARDWAAQLREFGRIIE